MWNKIFDIPAYIATVGLFVFGLLGVLRGEPVEEGDTSPMYFIIISFFLAMFIYSAKRTRRFHEKMDKKDQQPPADE